MRRYSSLCCIVAVCVTAAHSRRSTGEELSGTSFTRLPATSQSSRGLAASHDSASSAAMQSTTQTQLRLGGRAPVIAPFSDPQLPTQTRQALAFYGGYSARTTLSQMPRRAPLQPAPSRPLHSPIKPFQNFQPVPTISPYLNLDRDEDDTDIPTYFTYVRPQLEQQQLNQMQQRALQQLHGQLQNASAGGGQYQPAGTSARFMDTAQFYGSWR